MKLRKLFSKTIAVAATLAMVLTMLPANVKAMADAAIDIMDVTASAEGGAYEIKDAEGLVQFAELVNAGDSFAGATVTLAGDIDLNPGKTLLDADTHELVSDLTGVYEFPGIGTKETQFAGTFNGAGYAIKGLYMNSETNAYDAGSSYDVTALFNMIDNATIKNVGIYDAYIRLENGYGAGLVADTGFATGKSGDETAQVTNCFFIGQVDASGNDENWVGGLVGFFGRSKGQLAAITDCYADAIVKSGSVKRVGMIVGQNYGKLGNCYVTGGYIDAAGSSDLGSIEGRKGEGHSGMSYTVAGLLRVNGEPYAESTSSYATVLATADEVKELITNERFLAILSGDYTEPDGAYEEPAPLSEFGKIWKTWEGTNWYTFEEVKEEEPEVETPVVTPVVTPAVTPEQPIVGAAADDIKNLKDKAVLDTYKIYDAEGLYYFAELCETVLFEGVTIELANDIYLQDEGVVILGADFEPAVDLSTLKVFPGTGDVGFDGTFDGKNHVIYGLYMTTSEDQKFGLFGSTEGATIKNVGLVDAYILGDESARCRTGLLVGLATDTTVDNCFVVGSVDLSAMGAAEYVGALVGRLDSGSVTNCYGQGNVKLGNQHGGVIVGRNAGGEVSNCYVTGGSVSKADKSNAVAGDIPAVDSATVDGVFAGTTDTVMELAAIKALIKNENYIKAIEKFPAIQ